MFSSICNLIIVTSIINTCDEPVTLMMTLIARVVHQWQYDKIDKIELSISKNKTPVIFRELAFLVAIIAKNTHLSGY